MTTADEQYTRRALDSLFRRERARLIASLTRMLGPGRLDLAEDVAQEALLAAARVWPYQGLPDAPGAWLIRTARNKAIDRIRAERVAQTHADELTFHSMMNGTPADDAPPPGELADDDLRLIFLCCHDALSEHDRLALTLSLALGFTAREIGRLFLASETAMAQRLLRAKKKLRLAGAEFETPADEALPPRLSTVLKVVYLAFSLGYAPGEGPDAIRRDAAEEAVRLACLIADGRLTAAPDAKALAALLCFQASRFDARADGRGRITPLPQQNRAKWDRKLIARGFRYLKQAQSADQLSRYHLEAGVASAHAAAGGWEACDWPTICQYYDLLERITSSPVVAVNAAVALAMRGDAEAALLKLKKLESCPDLADYMPFYVAKAETLALLDRKSDAAKCLDKAISLGASEPELRFLEERLAACL